jgi:hypothetical protein
MTAAMPETIPLFGTASGWGFKMEALIDAHSVLEKATRTIFLVNIRIKQIFKNFSS